MTTLNTSGLHQTIVMAHQQVALDLLQSVEYHTDHDQQRRTSVEVGERLLYAQELHRQSGQNRHDGKEERTGERDTRHDGVDVVHGLLTRFHTRNKAAVSLHVIGHHLRVDDNRGVEVGERDYQHCKREVVPETGHRAESSREGRTGEQRRNKHQSLREDDRHHIRGIHFQKGDFAQAKLVRVLEGTVLDVAVDLRKGSKTFGKHVAVELSAENKRQLMIPRGFGHGFSVLSETAVFTYKCDNVYNKASEGGIRFDDPDINIDWKVRPEDAILSDKDKNAPFLKDVTCF